ncbi:phytanoyl-CoA dioxygenase family protein [Hoyosella altamirensis]|uniref:Ectoine hydroxylase-related dioxygenase (Phytanoyl-CoA dioxygenase family) n=1 Tax=Hoyosella altamirensis TaxID=616997 RepID=A0A839RU90_9ACTN|nr:phytanoyl-CoA dioxygenase family protein [Hoyosella altamirensis]MBB3039463.1 ectoine hydroxylase-related dioxygenase (phytanoyl-CoA dioxygenase family) [Hoyosella altamirensis]
MSLALPEPAVTVRTGWLTRADCSLDEFRDCVEQATTPADYPLADSIERNVPIYSTTMRAALAEGRTREVQTELAHALLEGPGIAVFEKAWQDTTVIDRATDAYNQLLAEQRAAGIKQGDHFAAPGANERLWGALEKLAVRFPDVFADYFANDIIPLVATAWLGPNYQIIADLNVVNPGGKAQSPHRDYHLGFMEQDLAAHFPAHVHQLSPFMTLQGAVAHCDMPVETGPTMYLPYSQRYVPGYLAAELPEFREYFDEHYVQLPLTKGDAVFFNPALFHGAGSNHSTDVRRMANLLQISSAFGRALGSVDRTRISSALYPTLLKRRQERVPDTALHNVIAASAEGYPFPTSLDRDQPVGSLNPESQAELVWRALREKWPQPQFEDALRAQAARKLTH